MSTRNKPRGGIAKEDFTDELNLWNSIVERIKKCHALSDRYDDIVSKIPQAEQVIPENDPTAALAALDIVSIQHRECLKLAEDELAILNEEPDDLIKNLETLISVRTAMEAETPAPRERHHPAQTSVSAASTTNPKLGRNGKRKLDALAMDGASESTTPSSALSDALPLIPTPTVSAVTVQVQPPPKKSSRSGSVSAASVTKVEPTSDTDMIKGVASTSTTNTTPTGSMTGTSVPPSALPIQRLAINSEVFYRVKSKDKSDEGEGIICTITNVFGDGKQRRYEVQDTEPDDNGHVPPPTRVSIQSLVAIPISNAGLSALPKGKMVFARYPATNTFYKAEVLGRTNASRKDMCRLRFEGEEDLDTEKEVERRYVLDIK